MRGFRVGVVRPRSPFGQRVRATLSEGELPTIELKLFESEMDESTLTQFGGEVIVTQPLDPDLFPHLDVLFFAGEESDVLNRLAHQAAEEGVLTLVEGAVGLGGSIVTPEAHEALRSGSERLGIVPRTASYLLGMALRPLAQSCGVERAVGTVLVPAQALGEAGVEELHQQVVQILNFRTPPVDVFHEQLAFNVKLAGNTPDVVPLLAESVAREASILAGTEGRLTTSLVQLPIFHGYAVSLWVETTEPVEAKELRGRYRGDSFEVPKSGRGARAPSPVGIAGSEKIHIGPIRRGSTSGPAGFWIWAVADTTAYDPGVAAVAIARAVLS